MVQHYLLILWSVEGPIFTRVFVVSVSSTNTLHKQVNNSPLPGTCLQSNGGILYYIKMHLPLKQNLCLNKTLK